MLFADVTLNPETIALLSTVIGVLFWQLIASMNRATEKAEASCLQQIKDLKEESKLHKAIANEAVASLEAAANEKRRAEGKPPFKVVADVVPEHSSPVTEEQQAAAEFQTMRAKLTAAKLVLDLAAREAPPIETAEQRNKRLADEAKRPPKSQ